MSTVNPATSSASDAATAPAAVAELAELGPRPPRRADARRNYDKVIAAARDAFGEGGADTSLEAIARRAGVGIGTLYRNFPNRQALLEAVYVGELGQLCASAAEFVDLEPWDAAAGWLRRSVAYLTTKHALAAELSEYIDRDAPVFTGCRAALYAAGEPLLARAQAAGEMRPDVTLADVLQMLFGIVKGGPDDPERMLRLAGVVLDGLRVQSPAA